MPDVYVKWETIAGDKYRGKIVEYDDGVLIVECSDGARRGVEETGYENPKSGKCPDRWKQVDR